VAGSTLSVFWKKFPALDRLRETWVSTLGGRGLDTASCQNKECCHATHSCFQIWAASLALAFCQTSVGLKLCISSNYTNRNLGREMFIAGYVNGSTRGTGAMLLAYMLTQCVKSPWHLPEVRKFMESVARIKATFVVYCDARSRAIDAWRAPTCQASFMLLNSFQNVTFENTGVTVTFLFFWRRCPILKHYFSGVTFARCPNGTVI
jgi:hypothetical protein